LANCKQGRPWQEDPKQRPKKPKQEKKGKKERETTQNVKSREKSPLANAIVRGGWTVLASKKYVAVIGKGGSNSLSWRVVFFEMFVQ